MKTQYVYLLLYYYIPIPNIRGIAIPLPAQANLIPEKAEPPTLKVPIALRTRGGRHAKYEIVIILS